MKSFIIFCVALIAIAQANPLSQEVRDKIKANVKTCLAESGVDVQLVKNTREGNFVEDPKLKAYGLCFSKKSGVINDAGELVVDVIRKQLGPMLTPEQIDIVVKDCVVQKDTPEETVYHYWKCWHNKEGSVEALAKVFQTPKV